jgi:hypothetical protein
MNKPCMNNNSITIEIRKQYLVEYLRWLFKSKVCGPISIQLNHPIGQHIYSMVFNVRYQLKRKKTENDIELLLPITKYSNYDAHYIHIYRWGEERINLFIESWFNIEFSRHMHKSERMGIEFSRAVNNFMFGRKINLTNIDKGSLIKKDWRFRSDIIQQIYNVEQNPEYQIYIQQ